MFFQYDVGVVRTIQCWDHMLKTLPPRVYSIEKDMFDAFVFSYVCVCVCLCVCDRWSG